MGRFYYDQHVVEFDDRILAHLQMVMIAKLRRGEPFLFTWTDATGRSAVWVNPSATIAFTFSDPAPQPINRAWIDALVLTANAPSGLLPVPEPEPRTERVQHDQDREDEPTAISRTLTRRRR